MSRPELVTLTKGARTGSSFATPPAALGAHLLLERSQDKDEPLRVYADPAGHPFCILWLPSLLPPPGGSSMARELGPLMLVAGHSVPMGRDCAD